MEQQTNSAKILVVDDEKDIVLTLKNILENEDYIVHTAYDGIEALEAIKTLDLDLIFLDLWLPSIDGLQILSEVGNLEKSNTPIVMISGHAGVESIVRATKIGASDFLEKPFTASRILSICDKYIKHKTDAQTSDSDSSESTDSILGRVNKADGFSNVKQKTKQRTIERSVIISGHALMNGRSTAIQLLPADVNHGIVFVDLALGTNIKLSPENILSFSNNAHANSTVLGKDDSIIRTTEHFLATLHMYGINNLIVKCDEEIPNIDGSALDFCKLIEDAGVVEQDADVEYLEVTEDLTFGDINNPDETSVSISPYDGLSITLSINFPEPIGKESYTYTFESPEHFKNEIGRARSFNTLDNIQFAQSHGVVGAGLMDSHIIISEGKVINTELRFKDEFVRHKILDLIGDLYILGIPFKGKIIANKTSHKFNHHVVRSIAQKYGYIS